MPVNGVSLNKLEMQAMKHSPNRPIRDYQNSAIHPSEKEFEISAYFKVFNQNYSYTVHVDADYNGIRMTKL